jgi:hypothetical protein
MRGWIFSMVKKYEITSALALVNAPNAGTFAIIQAATLEDWAKFVMGISSAVSSLLIVYVKYFRKKKKKSKLRARRSVVSK